MANLKEFLEFNDQTMYFTLVNGQWWIALKPICLALNVDWEAQRKSIKQDSILGELPSEQTVVAADGKQRKMVCLPELYIYGWLFSSSVKKPKIDRL